MSSSMRCLRMTDVAILIKVFCVGAVALVRRPLLLSDGYIEKLLLVNYVVLWLQMRYTKTMCMIKLQYVLIRENDKILHYIID